MRSKNIGKLFLCSSVFALVSCASVGDGNEASVVEPQSARTASDQAVVENYMADAGKSNKVICKRTRVVGSKFNKKVCGTVDEWEAKEQQSQETAEDFQKKGRGWEPTR